MSHSVRRTPLNEGSASAFAKSTDKREKKKENLADKAKSSMGRMVILMFPYIQHVYVFNSKGHFQDDALDNYVCCRHSLHDESGERFTSQRPTLFKIQRQ